MIAQVYTSQGDDTSTEQPIWDWDALMDICFLFSL